MIFRSPRDPIELPAVPLGDYVFERLPETADRIALVDGINGRRMTFGGVEATVGRAAAGLFARGYGKGDVFGIYSPNAIEYPLAFHAVARLGGVVTTVNPLFTAGELEKQLRDCEAGCLFTVPALVEKARAAATAAGLREVIVF